LSGQPAVPKEWAVQQQYRILRAAVLDGARPEMPDAVPPEAQALIAECWADEPNDRPTFAEIVDRLAGMEFQVTANVRPEIVREFVKRIEAWEKCHPGD
jgi:hypothetical protein